MSAFIHPMPLIPPQLHHYYRNNNFPSVCMILCEYRWMVKWTWRLSGGMAYWENVYSATFRCLVDTRNGSKQYKENSIKKCFTYVGIYQFVSFLYLDPDPRTLKAKCIAHNHIVYSVWYIRLEDGYGANVDMICLCLEIYLSLERSCALLFILFRYASFVWLSCVRCVKVTHEECVLFFYLFLFFNFEVKKETINCCCCCASGWCVLWLWLQN